MAEGARYKLCVDGEEFRECLDRDIRAARKRVYAQTLTFEGDAAGGALAKALRASAAPDRRLWADSMTEYLINDRFLPTPASRKDAALQAEVRATREITETLRREGVQVLMGDPIGRALYRLIIRNHKKTILVDDDVTFIGGINFSDHNFAWHDFMVRIECPEAAGFFREDFLATWEGERRCSTLTREDMDLYCVDGRGNHSIRAAVARLLGTARTSVYVQCPYITAPFFAHLGEAAARGAEVTVVISEIHNRGLMKEGIVEACRRYGLNARFYRGRMTHAKAMLVDDRELVLGSANFDFSSFGLQPEILGVFRDPGLIAEFKRRVIDTDLENTRAATEEDLGGFRGPLGYHGMWLVEQLFKVINKLP